MKGILPRLLLGVIAVGIGLYCSRDVWHRYSEQRHDADRAKAQMQQAEVHKAELQREKADLESKAGRERLARERGWLRPGEKIL